MCVPRLTFCGEIPLPMPDLDCMPGGSCCVGYAIPGLRYWAYMPLYPLIVRYGDTPLTLFPGFEFPLSRLTPLFVPVYG